MRPSAICFSVASHWLKKKGANLAIISLSVVKQNQSKREITFDTQMKTALTKRTISFPILRNLELTFYQIKLFFIAKSKLLRPLGFPNRIRRNEPMILVSYSVKQVGPVTWNDTLAKGAEDWATYLANNNLFKHASNIVPGENLYRSGSPLPDEPCTEASQLFYGEIKDYDYNKPGFAMNTGHFTQVRLTLHERLGFVLNSS